MAFLLPVENSSSMLPLSPFSREKDGVDKR